MIRPVTSPSNLFRRVLCPGSERLESQCEEPPESEEAAEGRLLHRVFAGETLTLNDEQQWVVSTAKAKLGDMQASVNNRGESVVGKEVLMRWQELEGTADHLEMFPDGLALVADLKCGRVEVDVAADNYQLSCYAILASETKAATSALVGIIQPRASKERRLTMAHYDQEGLTAAKQEVVRILDEAKKPDAPLVAGDKQCAYCRAQLICPAFKARFSQLQTEAPTKLTIADVSAPDLKRFFVACRTASRIEERVMDEVRRRILEGDPEFSDYELVSTGQTRKCTDLVGAYGALQSFFESNGDFDGKAFTECTTVVWKRMEELVVRLTGFTAARAKRTLSDLLEPFITWTPKRPSPTPKE